MNPDSKIIYNRERAGYAASASHSIHWARPFGKCIYHALLNFHPLPCGCISCAKLCRTILMMPLLFEKRVPAAGIKPALKRGSSLWAKDLLRPRSNILPCFMRGAMRPTIPRSASPMIKVPTSDIHIRSAAHVPQDFPSYRLPQCLTGSGVPIWLHSSRQMCATISKF